MEDSSQLGLEEEDPASNFHSLGEINSNQVTKTR